MHTLFFLFQTSDCKQVITEILCLLPSCLGKGGSSFSGKISASMAVWGKAWLVATFKWQFCLLHGYIPWEGATKEGDSSLDQCGLWGSANSIILFNCFRRKGNWRASHWNWRWKHSVHPSRDSSERWEPCIHLCLEGCWCDWNHLCPDSCAVALSPSEVGFSCPAEWTRTKDMWFPAGFLAIWQEAKFAGAASKTCYMFHLTHIVSSIDNKSTSETSNLCAVVLLTAEPKQILFHLGAVGQEFLWTVR